MQIQTLLALLKYTMTPNLQFEKNTERNKIVNLRKAIQKLQAGIRLHQSLYVLYHHIYKISGIMICSYVKKLNRGKVIG